MAQKSKSISLRKLIFNDKYLIITALLLAVLVWIITSLNIGTDETKTISIDIPIKISDDLSKQLGMQYYTLQDTVDIDVTISGAKYVIGQVSEKDLSIKFDTSNVNRAGEQSIPILVTNKSNTKDFTVSSVYPSSIDAYFDVEESETFDISLVYNQDNVADGYVFGTPVMSEDKVLVKGPKYYVDSIERIDAEIDFGKSKSLKESFSQDCDLKIKGSGVETNYLSLISKVNNEELSRIDVTLPVLKEAYLPVSVNFDGAPSGVLSKAVTTKYSTQKINVGILESTDINKAVIGTVNYNSLTVGENEFTFDLNDIQGVYILDEEDTEITVTVTVSDAYQVVSVPIKSSDITIKGAAKGATATVTGLDSTYVKVVVPKDTVLTVDDLKITADVSEVNEEGIYPLEFSVKDKASWVTSTYNATIEIKD